MRRKKQFRPKRTRQLNVFKPWPKGAVLGLTVFLFLVTTIWGLSFSSRTLKPALESIAEFQAKQAMTYAFNYSLGHESIKDLAGDPQMVTKQIENIPSNDYFIMQKNKQGKLVLVSYNTAKVNAFLYDKTQRLEDFLYALDNGTITINPGSKQKIKIHKHPVGRSMFLPLGLLTHMALFGNVGPRAPVRFDFLSRLSTKVRPKVQSAGVNTVHLTLYVEATTDVRLIFPFESKAIPVTKQIPIADITVQGDVPKLYNSSK